MLTAAKRRRPSGGKLFAENVQSDRNVTQPIPDTCSICHKMTLNSENKSNVILSVEMSTLFSVACISSLTTEGRPRRFLSCTLPVPRKRFTRRDIVDLFGTGESGNVPLN
jgi:hypothetical protein